MELPAFQMRSACDVAVAPGAIVRETAEGLAARYEETCIVAVFTYGSLDAGPLDPMKLTEPVQLPSMVGVMKRL